QALGAAYILAAHHSLADVHLPDLLVVVLAAAVAGAARIALGVRAFGLQLALSAGIDSIADGYDSHYATSSSKARNWCLQRSEQQIEFQRAGFSQPAQRRWPASASWRSRSMTAMASARQSSQPI